MSIKEEMLKHAVNAGLNPTGIEGIDLYKMTMAYPRQSIMSIPALCFIGQGQKQLHFGSETITYDEDHYLIGSMNMPVESELLDATEEKPYLGLVIHLDTKIIGELLTDLENDMDWNNGIQTDQFITACPVNPDLEEALCRLVSSISDPVKMKILGQDMKREIFYLCLRSEYGHILRNCVGNHANAHRMARIIHYIEKNFTENIDVKEIANLAGMSASSLHEHFKAATSLSPIQFIKKLRLHKAHALLTEGQSSSMAAFSTGYGNQAQFSREFKRYFGISPRDLKRL